MEQNIRPYKISAQCAALFMVLCDEGSIYKLVQGVTEDYFHRLVCQFTGSWHDFLSVLLLFVCLFVHLQVTILQIRSVPGRQHVYSKCRTTPIPMDVSAHHFWWNNAALNSGMETIWSLDLSLEHESPS